MFIVRAKGTHITTLFRQKKLKACTEHGGVDRTVLDRQQNQLGQVADFPPLLTFLIFDLTQCTSN